MFVQQDWIMRQIEMILSTILRLTGLELSRDSALPEELGPVYRAAMEAQAVLSRLPESEVQAIMRLRLEQEQMLKRIKAANQGSAAKASRFYSTGSSTGGGSRLGRA